MKNSSKQNQNWKFGFGLLAGALAGYWLNSDHGRRVRREVKDTAAEYGEKATAYVKEQASAVSEAANEYYQQGMSAVQSAKEAFTNTAESELDRVAAEAQAAVDEAESSMKKGFEKARKAINHKAETIV